MLESHTPEFDLIVIGGGINGSAVARDASMRGLSVLLLEAADLARGASGYNGRMIHGGLRYLETGQIDLVLESAPRRAPSWALRWRRCSALATSRRTSRASAASRSCVG